MPTPSATATATPTADPRTAPEPALDLTCDELYSLAELQPDFATTLSVKQDESSAPVGISDAAWLQAGGTKCVIGGENRTNTSYDQGLELKVLPNGATAYEARVADADLPATATDGIGDRSYLYCQGGDFGSQCQVFVAVGDWMFEGRLSDDQATTTEEASTYATAVFTTIANRIGDAGPARELWAAPTAPDPAGFCTTTAMSALSGRDHGGRRDCRLRRPTGRHARRVQTLQCLCADHLRAAGRGVGLRRDQ